MAQQEQDREDLLREATALVERAEFTISGDIEPTVIGFRNDGSTSVFLGVDPVYQFNRDDHLRRAYWQGFLFKSEQGRLVRLMRIRTSAAVELLRHELADDEQQAFIDELVKRLTKLRETLRQGNYQLIGQVPAEMEVMGRIQEWLDGLPMPPGIASSPRVSGGS